MSPNPPCYRKRGRYLIFVGTLDPGVVPSEPGDVPDGMTDIRPDRTVVQGLPLCSAVSVVRTLNKAVGPDADARPWRFVVCGPKHPWLKGGGA